MNRSITYALVVLFFIALIMLPTAAAAGSVRQMFTESDNGNTVSAVVGEPFMVRLAENPSTGYSWNLTFDDGLKLDSDQYVARSVPANIVGSGGNHEWTFTPEKPGMYVISGIYKRPWESITGSEQRFTLTVSVIGKSGGVIRQLILPNMDTLTFNPIQFPDFSNIDNMFMNFPAFDFGLD
jgi:inhibitor of cysteine peptidase